MIKVKNALGSKLMKKRLAVEICLHPHAPNGYLLLSLLDKTFEVRGFHCLFMFVSL